MSNVYDAASTTPGAAAQSSVSERNSLAAGRGGAATSSSTDTLVQSERLFSARARYGSEKLNFTSSGESLGGYRGEWAYMKLLTSSQQYSQYLKGTSTRKVAYSDIVSGMADPSAGKETGYDRFIISSVSADMTEKIQITEVFGDNEVIYYFGRQPLIFNFTGYLIDSPDNNWFEQWIQMYTEFLRGTQLAKNYELIRLVLPNMVLTGSISSFSWSQDSARDVDTPFRFQFIAKIVEPKPALNAGMSNINRLSSIDWSKANKFLGQDQINSKKGQLDNLSAVIKNPTASLRQKSAALSQIGKTTGGIVGSWGEAFSGKASDFQKTIASWDSAQLSFFKDVEESAVYQSVTSSLSGIRTNLFSPIYGVMTSLSKLVSNTFNSANRVFNNLITPLRGVIQDVTRISNQAIALVDLVNSSIRGLGRNVTSSLKGVTSDYKTAIKTLGKASGTIMHSPITVSNAVLTMFKDSSLSSTPAFLQVTPRLSSSKSVVRPGASLPSSKIALLGGISEFSSKSSGGV